MYIVIVSEDRKNFFVCKGNKVNDDNSTYVSFKIKEIWCSDDMKNTYVNHYEINHIVSVHFLNVFEDHEALMDIFK